MKYLLLLLAIPVAAQTIKSSSVGTSEASCSQVSGGDVVCTGGKVGIGTKTPQAPLDVVSTTSGIGIPSLTSAQVAASTPSRVGILIYNSTTKDVCISTGTTVMAYEIVGNTLLQTCQ